MQMNNSTILITGGGSGIGRALAERFVALGNHVIIAGRNKARLDAVATANPGMSAMAFDVGDAVSVASFAKDVVAAHPKLNTIIHNAGIMQLEKIADAPAYLSSAEATIATNLLGPIRLTAALLPHLLKQHSASLIYVSSGLAFVPLNATPTYCATKAALHSYAMALRSQLGGTSTSVIELAPPYVQTELIGTAQASDPAAMPLAEFADEVMALLAENPAADEIIVERCKPLRHAAESGKFDAIYAGLNTHY